MTQVLSALGFTGFFIEVMRATFLMLALGVLFVLCGTVLLLLVEGAKLIHAWYLHS